MGGAGEIQLQWQEMALPRSGVEVEQHPPPGWNLGGSVSRPAGPSLCSHYIFSHTYSASHGP